MCSSVYPSRFLPILPSLLKEYPLLITTEPTVVDKLHSTPLDWDDDNDGEVEVAWWRRDEDFTLVVHDDNHKNNDEVLLDFKLRWVDQVLLAWDEKDPWRHTIPFQQALYCLWPNCRCHHQPLGLHRLSAKKFVLLNSQESMGATLSHDTVQTAAQR